MSPACVLFKAPSTPAFTFAGVPPLVAKATTGNHDAANPQWRVTIPTTAAPGDLAIVSVSAINLGGATHTTPAGWTLLDSGTATSGFNNTARLYSKTLVAGDIGVMIQFGSSTDKWSTSVRVYRNAAIDAFAKQITNSKNTAFTQVSVTATQPRGVNVQIITGTGNQTWQNPARSAHASHHHTALQFGVPAFSGQTSQDKIYTSTGPTPTTGGIVGTPSGTGMACVQWNVLVYSTLPIVLPITDTYDRGNLAPPAGVGTTSDFKQSWYERGLNNVEINPWGVNSNELYLATSNTTGTVTYLDAGTPDVTASILVATLGTGDQGLLIRYDPTNDSRVEIRSNSSGAITTREINGAGVATVLGTTAGGTLASGQRLGCKVSGSTLEILVNGLTVATYASTQNQANGRFHGIVAAGTGTTLFRGNDYNLDSTDAVNNDFFDDFTGPEGPVAAPYEVTQFAAGTPAPVANVVPGDYLRIEGHAAIALVDRGKTNNFIEAKLMLSQFNLAILMVRYVDTNNYIYWRQDGVLRYRVGGVNTEHAVGQTYVVFDVLQVILNGSNISLRENGITVYSRTDAPLLASTKFGVGTGNGGANAVEWDDLRIG